MVNLAQHLLDTAAEHGGRRTTVLEGVPTGKSLRRAVEVPAEVSG